MILFTILVLLSILMSIECFELPDPNFVTDIVTNFNRLGVIYHLPSIARPDVLKYHKKISKFR